MPDVHAVVYVAKPAGGRLKLQEGETIDVKYFPFGEMPDDIIFGHRTRIEDAINGLTGMSVKQELKIKGNKIASRAELYALRDRSGLSRRDFYLDRIADSEIIETVELGG